MPGLPKPNPPASRLIRFYLPSGVAPSRLEAIETLIEGAYKLPARALTWPTNERRIVRPRQVAFFLARKFTDYSLPQIGIFFAKRHHTTVLYGVRMIEKRCYQSPRFKRFVAGLEEAIQLEFQGGEKDESSPSK